MRLVPFSHFVFLLLLLLHFFTSTPTDASKIIKETCKKCVQSDPNIDYKFCATSLQAFPGSSCTNLRTLGSRSIKLAKYNITHTRYYIKELMDNKEWDSYAKACMRDCMQVYSDAILSLKDVMNDYILRKYDDANIVMSSVMDASSTCEDCFQERKKGTVISPLTKRNDDIFQLCAISLSIINMHP